MYGMRAYWGLDGLLENGPCIVGWTSAGGCPSWSGVGGQAVCPLSCLILWYRTWGLSHWYQHSTWWGKRRRWEEGWKLFYREVGYHVWNWVGLESILMDITLQSCDFARNRFGLLYIKDFPAWWLDDARDWPLVLHVLPGFAVRSHLRMRLRI